MSRCYDLCCMECKKRLWVGQAGGGRDDAYLYANPEHIEALTKFLNDHYAHPLKFTTDSALDEEEGWEYVK